MPVMRKGVDASEPARPKVVIIGGGFAGVTAARALRGHNVEVLVIDRRNHHIFQPLLYQVATALLAPSEIATPIRELARKQQNLSVMLAEVVGFDWERRVAIACTDDGTQRELQFDYLVVAPGVQVSYFGHDEFANHSLTLKTLTDAETVRARVLAAYERAETTDDPVERQKLMTFVLVGAGPTGVELAASLAGMARASLRSNFRRIDPAASRIVLIEAGKRILPSFDEGLAGSAAAQLSRLGVEVRTDHAVEDVDADGVSVAGQRIASATVLWTAGVAPAPILSLLNVDTDRAGRIRVGPTLEVPGRPRVFVAGDAASVEQNGHPLPGVAQVAIQQGRYVARVISGLVAGVGQKNAFRYFDKGNMAVVGRNFALLDSHWLRMSGRLAWLIWGTVHLWFLPQTQNRFRVEGQWLWWWITQQRSSRLIPESARATGMACEHARAGAAGIPATAEVPQARGALRLTGDASAVSASGSTKGLSSSNTIRRVS